LIDVDTGAKTMKILLSAAALVALTVSGPASAQTSTKYFARSKLSASVSSAPQAPQTYAGTWYTFNQDIDQCSCPGEGLPANCPVHCVSGARANIGESNCNPATKPPTTSNGPMCPYM
jgi:hypothetical protein